MNLANIPLGPWVNELKASIFLIACTLMSACGQDPPDTVVARFNTLDDRPPLIVGHRGLPGLYPEETQPSFEHAADAGADAIEADLHLTKDCVLAARHNPWLSDNTNVAAVAATNAAVAARKRVVPGRWVDVAYDVSFYGGPSRYLTDLTDPKDYKSVLKSLIVDGEDHTGDWSIGDFTMAELKDWIRGTTFDARDERPTADNGKFPILSFQEVIDIAKAKSSSSGRTIAVYLEAKNATWNNAQATANGCGPVGSHPFEDAIIKIANDNGLNSKDAPLLVQAFDPASLKYLRSVGLKAKTLLLIDGNGVDYETGAVVYRTNDAATIATGRPYSWTLAGKGNYFGELLTPAGLAEVKTYADAIGVWKPQVMSWTIAPFPKNKSEGAPFTGSLVDVNKVTPTNLIRDAHAAGLLVFSFTFRDEARYLPGVYKGNPKGELIQFFAAGIDGVFTDFTPTAVAARNEYLQAKQHKVNH